MRNRSLSSTTAWLFGVVLLGCTTTSEGDADAGPDSGVTDDTGPIGDSGTPPDSAASTKLTILGEGSVTIAPGSVYKPSNIDGIPPFSSASLRISIRNDDTAAITIKEVVVTAKDGTLPDEWVLNTPGSTKRKPFSVVDVPVSAGGSTEFGLHFWAFASGPRPATVIVRTTTGQEVSFVVDGRGRDNLELSTKVKSSWQRMLAAPSADLNVGGIVSDGASGFVYSANATQLADVLSRDLVVSGVKADGTRSWAKVWNEPWLQESPPPDHNNETGGGADSIDMSAGQVYVAASRSVSASNSIPASFQAMVVKVDAATGAVGWARGFRNSTFATPDLGENVAWRGAMGFGVDATISDRVLLTGFTGSPPRALLVALDKATGNQIWAHQLDARSDGLADRGFSVRADSAGNGWIGGDENGAAMLVRLTGLQGATPAIAGAWSLGAGVGSKINSISLASNGDAIVSLWTGGAQRKFVAARLKTDGTLAWAKTWDSGTFGDLNNAHVVRLRGTTVFVGGNIAVQAADTTHGDGFVLGLDATTGAYKLGALYYSGKNTDLIAKHMVKGFVFQGTDVFTLTQGTTVQSNLDHYWGLWYQAPNDTLVLPVGDGSGRLKDFTTTPAAVPTSLLSLATGVSGPSGTNGGTAHVINTSTIWKDLPTAAVHGDPKDYSGEANQTYPLTAKLTLAD
ncbi:MAG: hypothetical protein JNL79_18710 [Myxococcales bacterium]|nr:hypothetical protein [Myxococcales bacterium]